MLKQSSSKGQAKHIRSLYEAYTKLIQSIYEAYIKIEGYSIINKTGSK